MLAIGRAEHDVHRDEESIVGPSSLLYPPAAGKTGGASYGWHGRSGRSGEASLETEADDPKFLYDSSTAAASLTVVPRAVKR